MRFVRGFLMCIGLAVPALALLFLLNVAVHRLLGPTSAERESLAALESAREEPREGSNAFALFWMIGYEVADADIERIAAEDVQNAHARAAAGRGLAGLVPRDRPRLAVPDRSDSRLCEERTPGCLARVRAHIEGTRSIVVRFPRWIDRMRQFERKDYYRSELPFKFDTPLPDPGPSQGLRLSAIALDWAEGRHGAALAELCENVGAWRRLRKDTNSLVFSMIAVSYMNGGINLFADMLAELPPAATVPENCSTALASIVASDVSMCTALATEMLVLHDGALQMTSRKAEDPFDRAFALLTHSSRQFRAWIAGPYAEHCDIAAADRLLRDLPVHSTGTKIQRLACASAIEDCILAEVAGPAYVDYSRRLLDAAARLRLAATLLWLRETRDDPRPLAERFAARPAHLRSGTRATGISEDALSIWVANSDTSRFGERTTLALAPPTEALP